MWGSSPKHLSKFSHQEEKTDGNPGGNFQAKCEASRLEESLLRLGQRPAVVFTVLTVQLLPLPSFCSASSSGKSSISANEVRA